MGKGPAWACGQVCVSCTQRYLKSATSTVSRRRQCLGTGLSAAAVMRCMDDGAIASTQPAQCSVTPVDGDVSRCVVRRQHINVRPSTWCWQVNKVLWQWGSVDSTTGCPGADADTNLDDGRCASCTALPGFHTIANGSEACDEKCRVSAPGTRESERSPQRTDTDATQSGQARRTTSRGICTLPRCGYGTTAGYMGGCALAWSAKTLGASNADCSVVCSGCTAVQCVLPRVPVEQ